MEIPNQNNINYSKIKQTCLCGISINLCDKIVMPSYRRRCPCVLNHFKNLHK